MGDELRRGFLQHTRLRAGLIVLVDEAPDAAVAIDLVHGVLLDDLTEVAAFAHPVTFLDDTTVHVHEVEAAVGTDGHVDDAEVGVGGADELRVPMRVGDPRDAVVDGDLGAADEAAHRLGDEHVATEIRRVAIGTDDFLSAGSGEVVEFLVGQGPRRAALVIGEADERPDLHEVLRELALEVERAVEDRGLEVPEALLAAGVAPPDLTQVVLREAPLAAAVRDGLLERRLRTVPAQTIGIIGLVEVIVQGPDQAALLVLEVAALGSALEPELLGVGDALPLGVAVDEDVLRIGLVDEDAIVEGEHHARQDELVAVDDVLVEATVALRAFVAGDHADGVMLVLAVDVLHVGAEFGDIHAAVAVEGDVDRLADAVALAEHKLQTVALRELDGREFLFRGEGLHARLRGEVRNVGRLVGCKGQATGRQEEEGLVHVCRG